MSKVWKVAPGEHADHWEMCRERGCILLGWRNLKDYRKYKSKNAVLKALSGKPGDGRGAASSIWSFTHEIEPSHIVVANAGRSSIVGIGIVRSEYLAPGSSKNPSDSERLPHARLVDWVIDQPIDLEPYFFGMFAVHSLSADKVSQIKQAYFENYPKLKETVDQLFAGISTDEPGESPSKEPPELASAEQQLDDEGAFDPAGIEDARKRIISSIVQRRGQPAFRKNLLAAYKGRCAITGCDVDAVLVAAHIIPYKGSKTNHRANGLLLRADMHTLFDLGMVAVDVKTMCMLVSPKLKGTSYEDYRGKPIRIPDELASQPNPEALEQHRQKWGIG